MHSARRGWEQIGVAFCTYLTSIRQNKKSGWHEVIKKKKVGRTKYFYIEILFKKI